MHHNRHSAVLIKSLDMVCIATMIVGLGLSLEPTRPAHAATFTVTKTADTNDGACSAADCSLREAIVAANAAAGADSIILPAGTYTLTIAGLEDFAAQGDLDLNGDLSLTGAGANLTTINAAGLDRVFDIAFGLRVTLSGLTISGGDTAAVGGGILSQGNLTVTNSTLSGNTAASGGGVFGSSSGTLTLRNTTVSGNSAGSGGGGLTSGGALTVTNSTISGNSAGGAGGGLSLTSDTARLMNVTITNNTGGNGGGIHNNTSEPINLRNTLLAGNFATGGGTAGPDCAEGLITLPIISQGYNLVGDDTNCSFASSTGDQIGTGGSPIDPGLGPLRNNGGSTLTHAILPGSPAIDAGNPANPSGGFSNACEPVDQRAQARTVDGDGDGVARCDIGAFEMNYTLAVDRADDFAPASFCTAMANDCSLRGAIRAANGSPEYDIILVPAGTYTLTIPGIGDNLALTGDLDFNSSLAVTGVGAVTIDGNGLVTSDRVFHVTGAYTVTISNVTIRGGNSSGVGGGLANPPGSRLTLFNTTLVSNTSSLDGGAIWNSGSLIIINGTLSGNTAGLGGGGLYSSGALIILNSTFSGNTATSGGGLKSSGALTLTNSAISGNIASAGGGGLMSLDALTIINSTLSGNIAGTGGGGLYSSGPLTITNSTLSGNTAVSGGGLAAYGSGATLNNVTVASNTVTSGDGGGILRSAGTINLLNTLLAGNSDLGGQAPDCWGMLTSLGHNLVGNVTGCTFSSATGDQVGAGASPIDPRLGPLQDNGGFTPTHALQGGGPAIDAGDDATCAAGDQRGVARPFGPACDIGAFELDVYALYLPLVRR